MISFYLSLVNVNSTYDFKMKTIQNEFYGTNDYFSVRTDKRNEWVAFLFFFCFSCCILLKKNMKRERNDEKAYIKVTESH